MRRRPSPPEDAPGQDSFLDIVANLVGILLILIVVIGVQAQDAWVAAKTPEPASEVSEVSEVASPPPLLPDVESSKATVEHITSDIAGMTDKIESMRGAIAGSFQQRSQLQMLVTAAERALEEQRDLLDDSQQRDFDLQRQIAEVRRNLDDLHQRRRATEIAENEPLVITHVPTPLAKTVFGREEHFRLTGGRLAYVPLNDLVARLKDEAPQKVWKLKDVPQITETIGPIQGFHLRYTLRRAERSITTRAGQVVQRLVELDHFVVVPVADELGEPISAGLQPGSELMTRLKSFVPNETTITIWTYPDSYDAFRRLKLELYELGFLTAARPLPDGQPISGSPRGTKSAAQ